MFGVTISHVLDFNSRTIVCPPRRYFIFQLTHLLRGATGVASRRYIHFAISTHAPLARCDRAGMYVISSDPRISTHAPLARCDDVRCAAAWYASAFQLTHLLRGATIFGDKYMCDWCISTHAPLARCDVGRVSALQSYMISTHAPLARCDGLILRRTYPQLISTHAPLARCDCCPKSITCWPDFNSRTSCEVRLTAHSSIVSCAADFNSRTSCEVRPNLWSAPRFHAEFQLTHLLRGATVVRCKDCVNMGISTHAPLARCDTRHWWWTGITTISTHAPLARCDIALQLATQAGRDFNSRTSCEVRRGIPEV